MSLRCDTEQLHRLQKLQFAVAASEEEASKVGPTEDQMKKKEKLLNASLDSLQILFKANVALINVKDAPNYCAFEKLRQQTTEKITQLSTLTLRFYHRCSLMRSL